VLLGLFVSKGSEFGKLAILRHEKANNYLQYQQLKFGALFMISFYSQLKVCGNRILKSIITTAKIYICDQARDVVVCACGLPYHFDRSKLSP